MKYYYEHDVRWTKSWILVSEKETDLTARSPTFYMGVSTV